MTLGISTLAREMVVRRTLANNCVIREKYLLKRQLGRIRDIRIDAEGGVFVLTESGILYRLEDSLGPAAESHL